MKAAQETRQAVPVSISSIVAGDNDRTQFPQTKIARLAGSIKRHGLKNPIKVRFVQTLGKYEIVQGECRFRACSFLGWKSIPAFIEDLDNQAASDEMLIENEARNDLDPVDQGRAYAKRIAEGKSVEEIADMIGRTTIYIQFRIKLLNLREDIQAMVRTGDLPLGYAQILADSGLDTNRQAIAIRKYNANDKPTPQWFRNTCNALFTEQAQEPLFDMLSIQFIPAPVEKPAEPPIPGVDTPSVKGATIRETLEGHIAFWSKAADQWSELGKIFKKQECAAAAAALRTILEAA